MSEFVRRSLVPGVLCLVIGVLVGRQWPGGETGREVRAREEPKADLQLTGSVGGFWLFDRASGDVWVYKYADGTYQPTYAGRIKEPGKPPVKP